MLRQRSIKIQMRVCPRCRHLCTTRLRYTVSPQETSRFFAARARSTNYAATAKGLAWQRGVKIGHPHKSQRRHSA